MEPVLILLVLLAVNLAGVALLDLLTGRAPWARKARWGAVVLGLPVVGPLLYFLRAAEGRRRRGDAAPPPPSEGRGGEGRPERPAAP